MTVGQFLVGAVADAYGRKSPLVISLTVFSAAAIACAMSTSLNAMTIGRFVQALGLGVAVVMARSVVADAFEGRAVARVYSTAVMATGVSTVHRTPGGRSAAGGARLAGRVSAHGGGGRIVRRLRTRRRARDASS